MKRYKPKKILRRVVQTTSLLVFFTLIVLVSLGFNGGILAIFLMFDPLSALTATLSSRQVVFHTLPIAILVLAITLIFGRFFCGYICPMGTTQELFDIIRRPKTNENYKNLRYLRYILLTAGILAALFGVNLLFHLLPMSLATRFYGLVILPLLKLPLHLAVSFGQVHFGLFGYSSVAPIRFGYIFFIIMLFTFLFYMSGRTLRFWCRYLCPTGALLGLFSLKSLYKLKFFECFECGACQKKCPIGCIDLKAYAKDECVLCKECECVCPSASIKFAFHTDSVKRPANSRLFTRRIVLQGAALGAAAAAASASELSSGLYNPQEHGLITPSVVRPPGALPESDFLARCVRCGECMVSCPTNGLQPMGIEAGSSALFSPILVARRGNCDETCANCGRVCPTHAIQALPLEEKQHAKIGTARVVKEQCIAWNEDKSCVICQEVCPYGAIKLNPEIGHKSSVPHVETLKCIGCGACENACPVKTSAIFTEPNGEIRILGTSYREKALEMGLDIRLADKSKKESDVIYEESTLPPGFVE